MRSCSLAGEDNASFWDKICEDQQIRPSGRRVRCREGNEPRHWAWLHDNHSHAPSGDSYGRDVLPSGAIQLQSVGQFEKGLCTTRFHKGFQRRMQSQIRQDEARLEREAQKNRRSTLHLARRRQRLQTFDKQNRFDLITGDYEISTRRSTTPMRAHVPPKTRNAGRLTEEAQRAEYLRLRDSMYKFHAPAWSGDHHDLRQDLLYREGLQKAKKSALLGIGSADLPSVGVEDMFSKAVYNPARQCPLMGLIEMTRPGLFTPRKLSLSQHGTAPVSIPTSKSSASDPQVEQVEQAKQVKSARLPPPPVLVRQENAVFRIIPAGLGNGTFERTVGEGSASVPGIAPSKRFATSKSIPLGKEGIPGRSGR